MINDTPAGISIQAFYLYGIDYDDRKRSMRLAIRNILQEMGQHAISMLAVSKP